MSTGLPAPPQLASIRDAQMPGALPGALPSLVDQAGVGDDAVRSAENAPQLAAEPAPAEFQCKRPDEIFWVQIDDAVVQKTAMEICGLLNTGTPVPAIMDFAQKKGWCPPEAFGISRPPKGPDRSSIPQVGRPKSGEPPLKTFPVGLDDTRREWITYFADSRRLSGAQVVRDMIDYYVEAFVASQKEQQGPTDGVDAAKGNGEDSGGDT